MADYTQVRFEFGRRELRQLEVPNHRVNETNLQLWHDVWSERASQPALLHALLELPNLTSPLFFVSGSQVIRAPQISFRRIDLYQSITAAFMPRFARQTAKARDGESKTSSPPQQWIVVP
jgi:hypothetical protein